MKGKHREGKKRKSRVRFAYKIWFGGPQHLLVVDWELDAEPPGSQCKEEKSDQSHQWISNFLVFRSKHMLLALAAHRLTQMS